MKVLDLQCQHGHSFEGWFGSEDDFQSQLGRGLVQCPICESAQITKKLSAPRLNLSGARDGVRDSARVETQTDAMNSIAVNADSMPTSSPNDTLNASAEHPKNPVDPVHSVHALMRNPEFQKAYMQMAKQVLAQTEDVGTQFAQEARKIHHGETPERGIRGQASRDEVMELLEDGIDVMPLPLPAALKGPLQ
jgi:hypothetical protein